MDSNCEAKLAHFLRLEKALMYGKHLRLQSLLKQDMKYERSAVAVCLRLLVAVHATEY